MVAEVLARRRRRTGSGEGVRGGLERHAAAAADGELVDRSRLGAADGGACRRRPGRSPRNARQTVAVRRRPTVGAVAGVWRLVSPPRMIGSPGAVRLDEVGQLVEVLGLERLVLRRCRRPRRAACRRRPRRRRPASAGAGEALHGQAVGGAAVVGVEAAEAAGPRLPAGPAGSNGMRDRKPRPSPTFSFGLGSAGSSPAASGPRWRRTAYSMRGVRRRRVVVVDEVEGVEQRRPPVEVLLRHHHVVLVEQRADERDVLGGSTPDLLGQPGHVVAEHRHGRREDRAAQEEPGRGPLRPQIQQWRDTAARPDALDRAVRHPPRGCPPGGRPGRPRPARGLN